MFCVNEYQTAVKRQRWEPNSESLQNLNVLWMPFWDYWWQMRINALGFYLFVFFFFLICTWNVVLECGRDLNCVHTCWYLNLWLRACSRAYFLPAVFGTLLLLVSFDIRPVYMNFGLPVFGFDLVFPWDFASLCYEHWSHSEVFLFCLYILWVISNNLSKI